VFAGQYYISISQPGYVAGRFRHWGVPGTVNAGALTIGSPPNFNNAAPKNMKSLAARGGKRDWKEETPISIR